MPFETASSLRAPPAAILIDGTCLPEILPVRWPGEPQPGSGTEGSRQYGISGCDRRLQAYAAKQPAAPMCLHQMQKGRYGKRPLPQAMRPDLCPFPGYASPRSQSLVLPYAHPGDGAHSLLIHVLPLSRGRPRRWLATGAGLSSTGQ